MSAPTITAPATASGGVPVGGSGAAGYLAKWTAATTLGGSSSTAGATASPFVDATGQIGIFTATPAEALTVAAGSNDRAGLSVASAVSTLLLGSKLATESARQLQFDRATGIFAIKYGLTGGAFTAGLAMDGSGNVGIGNTSPAATLHVGTGNATGLVTTGPAVYVATNGATSFVVRDATNSIESFLYAGSGVVLAGSATSHPYWIRTANTTRIAITATGEVGIGGTTTPASALEVVGTASSSDIATTSLSGTTASVLSLGTSAAIFTPAASSEYIVYVQATSNTGVMAHAMVLQNGAANGALVSVTGSVLCTINNAAGALTITNSSGSAEIFRWRALKLKSLV